MQDKPYILYENCAELPLSAFEKCLINSDYLQLVKSGTVDAVTPDIKSAWYKIYSEYCFISGDEQVMSLIAKMTKIYRLEYKILAAKANVSVLKSCYNQSSVDILHQLGYKLPFNYDNKEQYNENVRRALSMIRGDEATLLMLHKSVEKYQKKDTDKIGVTHIDEMLILIEKHMKIPIVKDNISVQRYCLYIKDIKNSIQNKTAFG